MIPKPWARVLLAIAVPIALFTFVAQTAMLQAAVTQYPPIARIVHGAQDLVLEHFAPTREGYRWIEVDDPRTRRADKLRIPSH